MTHSAAVTMARIAEDVGVSVSTVSNAYHRPEKLSLDLRARILGRAEALGYPGPDPFARTPRRGRPGTIGLVFADELSFAFHDAAASGFLTGVCTVLTQRGYNLTLVPAGTPDHHRVAPLNRSPMHGIVLHSLPDDDPTLSLVGRREAAAVLVDQPRAVPGMNWVGLDETRGSERLGDHLRRLGHSRVGYVSSRLDSVRRDGPATGHRWRRSSYAIARQRIAALERGLRAEVIVEERWNVTRADGAMAAAALFARDPRITAIVCIADTYAMGVLSWAKAHRIDVPHHLSVAGHDDIPEGFTGLTTVRQPVEEKGRVAATLLLDQLDQHAPRHRTLLTEFVERSTTGPCSL